MNRPYQQGGGRGGPSQQRGSYGSGAQDRRSATSSIEVLFDPARSDTELFDALAEEQAKKLPSPVNSSQLRRYFGELKGLYNQFRSLVAGDPDQRNSIYQERIEARFKMLRSKLAYGRRPGARGSLDKDFARVLEEGIGKVKDSDQFTKFVLHIEAVVGFMYGNEKVSK